MSGTVCTRVSGDSTGFDHARRRAPTLELGNLDVARDFSDVRFVVESYRKLIESGHSGTTVNICSGVPTSLRDVLALVRELSGHDMEIRVNPDFVRANAVKTLCGDPSPLYDVIGESPPIALRETLQWMLQAT